MIRSYLKIIFRNLIRERVYSLINILGLSVGIAGAIVILMHVHRELSFDKTFAHGDRIYRVGVSFMGMDDFASGPEHLMETFSENSTLIEAACRVRVNELPVYASGERYEVPMAFWVDSTYFQLFEHTFLRGSQQVLLQPSAAIISEKLALDVFGSVDVIGKELLLQNEKIPATIEAVIRMPELTHLNPDVILPIVPLLKGNTNWMSASFYTFFLTREGTSLHDVEQALEGVLKTHVHPQLGGNQSYEAWLESNHQFHFTPIAFQDIYLRSAMNFELVAGGSMQLVVVFSFIALLVLLIAVVNFVNLSTARSSRRIREVGIRKTFGTSRIALIGQFLLESISMSVIAMLLGFGLAETFLVLYQNQTGAPLIETVSSPFASRLWVVLLTLITGVIGGSYPAFYLTSFKPAEAFKSKLLRGGSTGRNVLVTLQFVISIVLIICATFINQQIQYMKDRDLGLDKDNVLVVTNASELGTFLNMVKDGMDSESYVRKSSLLTRMPAGTALMRSNIKSAYIDEPLTIDLFRGDHHMLSTLGVDIINGRDFSSNPADTSAVLINESAIQAFGLPADPIGERLNQDMTVIGIVRDFHFESMEHEIQPVVIQRRDNGSKMALKLNPGSETQALDALEALWKQAAVEEPMQYYFLDDNFTRLAEKELQTSRAITMFTILAIFISCLGLFGLSAYTAEKRKREIGIRKVLGASLRQIHAIMVSGFARPVLVALVLALPVAYQIVTLWLEQFAYQMEKDITIFAVSSIGVMLLAWITVSFFSYQASQTNPTEVLRDEG